MLSENAREKRKAYFREWRRKNPEKAKIYSERYWEKKAKECERHEGSETK